MAQSATSQPAFTLSERTLTLGAVLVVFLLGALHNTIVSTAMPRIIADLSGLSLYTWVTTAYLLASTVMVPIYGKLSDMYGRKPILTFGVSLFLVGSVLLRRRGLALGVLREPSPGAGGALSDRHQDATPQSGNRRR